MSALYRVANVGLRLSNILARFILTIYIAKYFEPTDLGLYGLIVAAVSFAIYPLGFEFYTYSTRELVGLNKEAWGTRLSTQIVFHFVLYLIFIPVFLCFIEGSRIEGLAFLFVLLVVFEHANQEFFRLHIIEKSQLIASLNVVIRHGFWAIVYVVTSFYWDEIRNIESLLVFWICGQVAALFYSIACFYFLSKVRLRLGFDRDWLLGSFKSIVPLFIATFALRALGTGDRFLLEYYGYTEQLSAYVFYIAFASLVFTVADAGVFSFRYIDLAQAVKHSKTEYKRVMRSMSAQAIGVSLVTSLLLLLFCKLVVSWVGNDLISMFYGIFVVLLLAKNLQVIGMIFHYGMYARKMDRKIMIINSLGVLGFVLFVIFGTQTLGIYAVPVGLCVSFLVIMLFKAYCVSVNSADVDVISKAAKA